MLDTWERTDKSNLDRNGAEILIDAQGKINRAKVDQLLQQRDNRPVELIE